MLCAWCAVCGSLIYKGTITKALHNKWQHWEAWGSMRQETCCLFWCWQRLHFGFSTLAVSWLLCMYTLSWFSSSQPPLQSFPLDYFLLLGFLAVCPAHLHISYPGPPSVVSLSQTLSRELQIEVLTPLSLTTPIQRTVSLSPQMLWDWSPLSLLPDPLFCVLIYWSPPPSNFPSSLSPLLTHPWTSAPQHLTDLLVTNSIFPDRSSLATRKASRFSAPRPSFRLSHKGNKNANIVVLRLFPGQRALLVALFLQTSSLYSEQNSSPKEGHPGWFVLAGDQTWGLLHIRSVLLAPQDILISWTTFWGFTVWLLCVSLLFFF